MAFDFVLTRKGSKERRVPASPRLLEALRAYWKIHRPSSYLFPGKHPNVPLSSATVQKARKLAGAMAGIKKPKISPHCLRHTYATSMLKAGVDLLTISKLLGHASFITTMIYLHVRRQHFDRAPSPIDWLPTRQCPQWIERSSEPPCNPSSTTSASPTGDTPPPPSSLAATPLLNEQSLNEQASETMAAEAEAEGPRQRPKAVHRQSGRSTKRKPRHRRG